MDKKGRVPPSNVPIIGEKARKERDVALVNTILAQIDPVMQRILEGIDGLERRIGVVEGIQKVFPEKVEVTVKQEQPQVGTETIIDLVFNRVMDKIKEKK